MSNIQKQHKISPAIAWLTIQKFIIFYCPLDGEHTNLDVLASFAAYFHVTLDQLILHDLKAEGFTADSDPSSVMMESKTPYMQGIEKNTGNYIYLTEEELNLILAFRSSSDEQRKIVTGFLNSDK